MVDQDKVINCLTCGEGKNHWFKTIFGYKCSTCEGDPLKGNGRSDWKDFYSAQFVFMFGPRKDGDMELLTRYRKEFHKRWFKI